MRILVLLGLSVLLVAGCGDGEREGKPHSKATLRIEPLEVRGASFVEGSVYALQVEGVKGWSKPRQYSEPVTLKLRPGTYDVMLRNYVCNSACPSWPELEKLMARQRASHDGSPGAIERTVTQCEGTVAVKQGKKASMAPYIDVAVQGSDPLGPTGVDYCRWEGRGVEVEQTAGFTASGAADDRHPQLPSFTSTEKKRICAAADQERTIAQIYREHGLAYDSRVLSVIVC